MYLNHKLKNLHKIKDFTNKLVYEKYLSLKIIRANIEKIKIDIKYNDTEQSRAQLQNLRASMVNKLPNYDITNNKYLNILLNIKDIDQILSLFNEKYITSINNNNKDDNNMKNDNNQYTLTQSNLDKHNNNNTNIDNKSKHDHITISSIDNNHNTLNNINDNKTLHNINDNNNTLNNINNNNNILHNINDNNNTLRNINDNNIDNKSNANKNGSNKGPIKPPLIRTPTFSTHQIVQDLAATVKQLSARKPVTPPPPPNDDNIKVSCTLPKFYHKISIWHHELDVSLITPQNIQNIIEFLINIKNHHNICKQRLRSENFICTELHTQLIERCPDYAKWVKAINFQPNTVEVPTSTIFLPILFYNIIYIYNIFSKTNR